MITMKIQDVCVPALGFGTWRLRDRQCVDATLLALETGYRHIDTAQAYQNEAEIGDALAQSLVPRSDIFLTTKIDMPNVSRDRLESSLDESLAKLKTDYVDLLLIHWPVAAVPFAEQLEALTVVQKTRKTRLIGVSNFTVAQLTQVRDELGFAIACNQVEYHPFLSQKPVLDVIRSYDMFLTAYAPLARGKVAESDIVCAIAARHHKTPGQVALRWLVQQGNVAAIPKAATPDNIRNNFNISDFTLTEADMAAIHALARPDGRLIDPDWAPQWDQAV